jgi:ATP-grasp domain
LPNTVNVTEPIALELLLLKMHQAAINFPCIAKPEYGGRGRKVAVINNKQALQNYMDTVQETFMVQEKIDFPVEVALFFYKLPNTFLIEIPGIVIKEFMTVTGNGIHTIAELMQAEPRYIGQLENVKNKLGEDILKVLPKGQAQLLEPIGNHCKGTIFRNATHLVNDAMIANYTKICNQIPGYYYGRFDMKVPSLQDLNNGTNIKVLELNGINADMANIFDPNATLREAIFAQWQQAKKAFIIAKHNKKNGAKVPSFLSLYNNWKNSN